MNLARKLAATAAAALIIAAASAQTPPQLSLPGANPTPTPTPAPKFSEAQLLETFGWFVGKRIGIQELKFSPEQTALIIKGLQGAAAGKEAPYKLEEIGPEMDKFLQDKQQQYLDVLKKQGLEASAKFLTEIKGKAGVVTMPSGLSYEILKPGTGEPPKPTDSVKVHYTGTLIDGSVFDSSVQRNEPAEFLLDQVVPGWTEGLQKINKGGKIKLYVPPHLAYGDDARPGIPPASTLIFEVELLDFKSPSPGSPAPAPAPAPGVK